MIASASQQSPVPSAVETMIPVPSTTAASPSSAPSIPVTAPFPTKTFNKASNDAYVPPAKTAPASLGPSTLSIPSLGVSASIVSGGAKDGGMVLPESSKVAEYTAAAPLASDKGSTVIAGHVNFADGSAGALGPLYKITKGTPVYATEANGTVHEYKVTSLSVLSKQALPYDIFRTAGSRQLVLVTCGGDIENVNGVPAYTHNLVVTAEPV